ncbi:C40 family peptidase [Limnohabitans sp. 2KL-51]|jgi:cell wall-associated NlpC family hydrolase|uniref:C40 family peptidase n=1 Tax=Limnohabitans sp. 2KL-51 TaxID=1977911 RepID=UPI000D35661A|nr:C40 family peptidase [Limnohabitans sp. 2KL-51]
MNKLDTSLFQTLAAPRPTRAAHDPQRRKGLLTGLGLVSAVLLAGCSSPPARRTAPANSEPANPAASRPRPSGTYNTVRNDVAMVALSLLDTPYAWGGRGPATGFDCSGLVAHVLREGGGLRVQGSAADLGRMSRPIDTTNVQPGDLVFFNTLGARHSHVGVYVGDGRFVHASNPRTGVRIDAMSNRYYAQRFEGAHSLLD